MQRNIVALLGMPVLAVLLSIGGGVTLAAEESQEGPVLLDAMGPSSIVQRPTGAPTNQALHQQQYMLKNLSSKDILFYNIAFVGEQGTIIADLGGASYPPQPPLIKAGATKTIKRLYLDNAGTAKVQAQIDSIVFADGTSYGPDTLKRKAAYVASAETQYLFARSMVDLFTTQGPEAVRQHLLGIIEKPNAVISMSAANAVSRNKGTVKIGSVCPPRSLVEKKLSPR